MQFLYFEPLGKDLSNELGYVSGNISTRGCDTDMGKGNLLFRSMPGSLAKIRYSKAEQTWVQIPGSELWIGYWNDDKPTPADLERDEMIEGYEVKIDSKSWSIPVCRKYVESEVTFRSNLPRALEIDESGQWVLGSVIDRHIKLWDASTRWFEFKFGNDDIELMQDEVADMCFESLSTNYRVSKMELSLLKVVQTTNQGTIMDATIDYASFEAHMKKKRLEEPLSSTPGSEEETPVSVPA